MAFPLLTVEADTNSCKAQRKGRSFSAHLLGYFAANSTVGRSTLRQLRPSGLDRVLRERPGNPLAPGH